MNIEKHEIFKVLSDKNRFEILNIIKEKKEICACEILEHFDITQATLAYHMKLLKDVGLVTCIKEGVWCKYKVNQDTIYDLYNYFQNFKGK